MLVTKKKIIKAAALTIAIFLGIALLRACFLYFRFMYPGKDYFDDKYIQIIYPTGISDYFTAKDILKNTESALSTITTNSNAEEEFGKLEYFCITDDDASYEEHSINLISANFTDNNGYMWISYHQVAYDKNNEIVTASGTKSGKILARLELIQNENEWEVVSVDAPP